MNKPFASYFHLVRSNHRKQLAQQFEANTERAVLEALVGEGLLTQGAPATHYTCIEAGTACPRRVIAYKGPRPDIYCARAVPPERHFCCSAENLTPDQVRTYVADESRLVHLVNDWLGAESAVDAAAADDAMYRIGYLVKDGHRTRVFLARRVTTRAARDRLRELESVGGGLVVALMREEGLTADLEERYGGRSAVRIVFLEDYLRAPGRRVEFSALLPVPRMAALSTAALPVSTLRILDQTGERTATEEEVRQLRAAGDLHLFVDLTVSAKGGGAAGYATVEDEHGTAVRRDFVLPVIKAKILVEYVRAGGKPLMPQRLQCVRAAGIRDGARLVRELRALIDQCWGRDQYRAFQSHKNTAGLVSEFSFRPPSGFRMVIILSATD